MGKHRHRILFDLSPALLEFAGIPQTTRQLFDLLSRSPEFEVTGLIWGTVFCTVFTPERFIIVVWKMKLSFFRR